MAPDTYANHWLATGDSERRAVLCPGSGEDVPDSEVTHGSTAGGSPYVGGVCWHCGRLVDTVPAILEG